MFRLFAVTERNPCVRCGPSPFLSAYIFAVKVLLYWYLQHKEEVMAAGTPDSLRVAGVGGVNSTRAYRLPYKEFRIGNGEAVLDSVTVDEEDGTLGLDLLEQFRTVILNLEEMYLNGIPY